MKLIRRLDMHPTTLIFCTYNDSYLMQLPKTTQYHTAAKVLNKL